jgi:F-type H+-transporting ATPase subunit c
MMSPAKLSTPRTAPLGGLIAASVAGLSAFLVPALALAAEGEAGANANDVKAYATIGAGIAIGLGAMGGALGQGRAAAAALEGIARTPGAAATIQTPMILGLALIESLVLVAFGGLYLILSNSFK